MKKTILSLFVLSFGIISCAQQVSGTENKDPMSTTKNDTTKVVKTEEEWKSALSPEQYFILREKGTERPFTGKFTMHKERGIYSCAGCGNELFTSDMKFDSHCGWPSFDKEIAGGKISTKTDSTHGMMRMEIMCAKCGGHLGHIFDDGPTATGQRYCVNSLSLEFKEEKK